MDEKATAFNSRFTVKVLSHIFFHRNMAIMIKLHFYIFMHLSKIWMQFVNLSNFDLKFWKLQEALTGHFTHPSAAPCDSVTH